MAKVRIQARSANLDTVDEEHNELPGPHYKKSHHVDALTVLARVWKREGFVGWYQVS